MHVSLFATQTHQGRYEDIMGGLLFPPFDLSFKQLPFI